MGHRQRRLHGIPAWWARSADRQPLPKRIHGGSQHCCLDVGASRGSRARPVRTYFRSTADQVRQRPTSADWRCVWLDGRHLPGPTAATLTQPRARSGRRRSVAKPGIYLPRTGGRDLSGRQVRPPLHRSRRWAAPDTTPAHRSLAGPAIARGQVKTPAGFRHGACWRAERHLPRLPQRRSLGMAVLTTFSLFGRTASSGMAEQGGLIASPPCHGRSKKATKPAGSHNFYCTRTPSACCAVAWLQAGRAVASPPAELLTDHLARYRPAPGRLRQTGTTRLPGALV